MVQCSNEMTNYNNNFCRLTVSGREERGFYSEINHACSQASLFQPFKIKFLSGVSPRQVCKPDPIKQARLLRARQQKPICGNL
jgi:hypothetical protein